MSAPECDKCGKAYHPGQSCLQAKRLKMLAQIGDAFEVQDKRIAELEKALKTIAYTGTDCAAADYPESFYRGQLQACIATAACAFAKLEGNRQSQLPPTKSQ